MIFVLAVHSDIIVLCSLFNFHSEKKCYIGCSIPTCIFFPISAKYWEAQSIIDFQCTLLFSFQSRQEHPCASIPSCARIVQGGSGAKLRTWFSSRSSAFPPCDLLSTYLMNKGKHLVTFSGCCNANIAFVSYHAIDKFLKKERSGRLPFPIVFR